LGDLGTKLGDFWPKSSDPWIKLGDFFTKRLVTLQEHRHVSLLMHLRRHTRVARWHIFKPKIPIWVYFGGPWNLKNCYNICPFALYVLQPFDTFYGHLVI
jgi:hypothetical protein